MAGMMCACDFLCCPHLIGNLGAHCFRRLRYRRFHAFRAAVLFYACKITGFGVKVAVSVTPCKSRTKSWWAMMTTHNQSATHEATRKFKYAIRA